MPEDDKDSSSYYWGRVNALRYSIAQLDKMSTTFSVTGPEGSVRSIMASALLYTSLCASFTQAIEILRAHAQDIGDLEGLFVSTAKKAIADALNAAKTNDPGIISWPEVVGSNVSGKVYDPYGTNKEKGEKDG